MRSMLLIFAPIIPILSVAAQLSIFEVVWKEKLLEREIEHEKQKIEHEKQKMLDRQILFLAISNRLVYEKTEKLKRESLKPVLEEKAIQFLKQRLTNGSPEAAFEMYERYRDGKGVNNNADEAFRYLMLSALNGNEKAKKILTSGNWKSAVTNSYSDK